MAEFKISNLRFNYKGQWDEGVTYNRDAMVTYMGKTYVCLVPHTSESGASAFYDALNYITPESVPTPYWKIIMEGNKWMGDWTPNGMSLDTGCIVTFGGTQYIVTTPHVSGSNFVPENFSIYSQGTKWNNDWLPSTLYGLNDLVKYGGIVYRCILEHESASTTTLGLEEDQNNWSIYFSGIDYTGDYDSNSYRYRKGDLVKNGANQYTCTTGHVSTSTFDLTKWSIYIPGEEYEGSWDSSTVYQIGDVVTYGGYSYVSKTTNNTANIPSTTNSATWSLLTTGYNLRGDWNSGIGYRVGDVVRRGGQLFAAISDSTGSDPTSYSYTTNYVASGSSGTTLKVTNTSGIVQGMVVLGQGFSAGQTVISVLNSTTVILDVAPDTAPVNAQTLIFYGISPFWNPIVSSTRWKNFWTGATSYLPGDLAVYNNTTFRCIQTHTSNPLNRPDLDTTNSYWIIFLLHARKNALVNQGDIVNYANGRPSPLAIGTNDYLLRSNQGTPTWSNILITPNVFYVSPDGQDRTDYGLTLDKPWKTIKYACNFVLTGTQNVNANTIVESNKEWLVREMYQWMVYQMANNIAPFNNSLTFDQTKTLRDARLVIDAICYDITRGGNSQTVATALSYFEPGANKNKFFNDGVAEQMPYFIKALQYLQSLIPGVLLNQPPVANYQVLTNYQPAISQTFFNNKTAEAGSATIINSYFNVIIDTLEAQDTSILPTQNQGISSSIFVKTGTYKESLPIVVPENTAIIGDELRGVVVEPLTSFSAVLLATSSGTDLFTATSTQGLLADMPIQFAGTLVIGGITAGQTYYVLGNTISGNQFSVSESIGGAPVTLTNGTATLSVGMTIYAGDCLKDMFLMRNGSGLRNMTFNGLKGTLTAENEFGTSRPTGGAYSSLDPGNGPNDSRAWIYRRSPYCQNVTMFGQGCTGMKIDGTLHNGGNRSMVANDYTTIVSDGIGVWATGSSAVTELVSVFNYYGYMGYLAEEGARIRATNGNSSYGTYGVVAEGYDVTEIPVTGNVYNKSGQANGSVVSAFGTTSQLLKVQYLNAGNGYTSQTTNLIKYSNLFNTTWVNDGNVSITQTQTSPFGFIDAWTLTGTTAATDTSYLYQNVTISPTGGTFSAVSPANLSGSGAGVTFNVTVSATGYSVVVNGNGSGYVVGNQMKINGSTFGGIDGTNDLFLTVFSLIGSGVQTVTTSGVVPANTGLNYTLSVYVKKGTSSVVDLYAIFSGTSSKASAISYNFDSNTITASSQDGGGTLPTQYGVQTVHNGWYRIWFAVNDITSLNNNLQYRLYPRSRTGVAGFTYIYGAQLEISPTTYAPSFYLETKNTRFSAYANYKIVGAGTGADIIGNETRSNSIFQTRVTDNTGAGAGGAGYLTASNNCQGGDTTKAILSQADVGTATQYSGMRIFINSGTGAGQYGFISDFSSFSKYAYVLRDSFTPVIVTNTTGSTTNTLTLASSADINSIYLNQPVQFIPTVYSTTVTKTSQSSLTVTSVTGGSTNTLTVSDTTSLQLNMPIQFAYTAIPVTATSSASFPFNTITLVSGVGLQVGMPVVFSGSTFGGLTAGVTYYIKTVVANAITVSLTNSGTVSDATVQLGNAGGTMVGSAGGTFGGTITNFTYYVNSIVDQTTITISTELFGTDTPLLTSVGYMNLNYPDNTSYLTADTTNMIVNLPIQFTGSSLGGVSVGVQYYINDIVGANTFTISSALTSVSVTATTVSTDGVRPNQLTCDATNNLVVLNPIIFTGSSLGGLTLNQKYYIQRIVTGTHFTVSSSLITTTATATQVTTNLITVTNTAGFVVNNPIIFTGTTFGGLINETVYYILAINDSTTFTISTSPGGTAKNVDTGTGSVSVRTAPAATTLSTDSGVMTGSSTSAKQTLTDTTGSMIASFSAPLFGGLVGGTTYYVKTITPGSPNTIQISGSSGGSVLSVTTASGSMQFGELGWDNINKGTPAVAALDTTSLYFIEPRVVFDAPTFSQTNIIPSLTTQQAGSQYVSVVGANGIYMAVANANTTISISTDGEQWVGYTLPGAGATWSSLAYGNKYWVLISSGGTGNSRVLYSNSNGLSWKSSTLPSATGWTKVVYGNGNFVAIANSGTSAAYSTNFGATWTASTLPTSTTWKSIAYGAGVFVAIGSSGTIGATSSDGGATWSSVTLPVSTTWSDIAYGNGRFVAVSSSSSTPGYSFNGSTWYTSPYSITGTLITYGQGVFVVLNASSTSAYTSESGHTFTFRTVSNQAYSAVGFGFNQSNVGKFITAAGTSTGTVIYAGARTEGRATVTTGVINNVVVWEPGSNYSSLPTVTFTDPNVTQLVTVTPRLGNGSLSSPTFYDRGVGYSSATLTTSIWGNGYADDYQTGLTIVCNNLTSLPQPGDNITFAGNDGIYKVTSASVLYGSVAPSIYAAVSISPIMSVALTPADGTSVQIRTKYSQCRCTNHDFLYIGVGGEIVSAYPNIDANNSKKQNQIIESNFGRVFYSSTDQDGNFKVGTLFGVEQATGIVTLSASQFGLTGLSQLRLGGITVGGNAVVIQQFSIDPTFVANSDAILPTQKAIKTYLASRLSQGGANTFTGQLTAGLVVVGGPDRLGNVLPQGNTGSSVKFAVKANFNKRSEGLIDGGMMALDMFIKSGSRRGNA